MTTNHRHEAEEPRVISTTPQVLAEVHDERRRQEAKWGQQDHPNGTGPYMLGELVADGQHTYAVGIERWARQRCDKRHRAGMGTYEQILTEEWAEAVAQSDPAKLRAELIQVAAVAVAWVESIDRQERLDAGGEGQ